MPNFLPDGSFPSREPEAPLSNQYEFPPKGVENSPRPTAFAPERARGRRNKFDNPVLKMRVGRVIERATVKLERISVGYRDAGSTRRFENDDQGMHEQQVSSLCPLRLYRGHALRSLPVRPEGGAEEYRRCWTWARNYL